MCENCKNKNMTQSIKETEKASESRSIVEKLLNLNWFTLVLIVCLLSLMTFFTGVDGTLEKILELTYAKGVTFIAIIAVAKLWNSTKFNTDKLIASNPVASAIFLGSMFLALGWAG